jgi:hypothetical protein
MDSPAKEQQETQSESLEDIISETFDEMESEDSGDVEEVETEVEEAEAEIEAEAAEAEDDGEEEVAEELQEEIEEAAESDYQEPAPDRWPDEIKEVYNSLPPEARKAMLEGVYKPMQRSYTTATQEMAQQRQQLEPILSAMKQYSSDFERAGVNPVEAFRSQLAWAAHFQRVGAEQGLSDMQAAYGLGDKQPAGQGSEYLTPAERNFKQQIDALQQQIQGQQQQTVQQQQQQQINAQRQEIQSVIQNFVNEKAEDGSPKHPHVDKVASNIAGIIRGGLVRKADDYGNPISMRDQMAQAYTMACDLDPSIRTPSVGARQARRAKAAQKVSVVTKHPAGRPESDELDISSFIEKTYDELAGR